MDKGHEKKRIGNSIFPIKESELSELLIINTIMNNSQDTIYFKDRNSTFVLSSKAHALGFGIDSPLELIGKNDYDYFPKDFADNAYRDEQQIIDTGEPIINRVEKWIKPDGNIVWLLASKYPLYNSQGEIIGTWGTSRDITSLKNAQEELVQLNTQLEEANRQLRILSAIDSLSGLYNHRHFFEELEKAFTLYKRQKEKGKDITFSVILLDIDDFKTINDTYGHLMGDLAIRHIGEILTRNTRSTDSCFRYGGDEFAILLPDTSIQEASLVAEKIRTVIEKTSISSKQSELYITISLGVTSFYEAKNVNCLFQNADKKLYSSKHQGKNKVTF
ncbi:PAS domain S-box-containing protein/diguanylate cyclase (GGDEF) domain-containing protein [Natronincola peptidivorans]|uniref:PAS domain S-box-containing protein/diguanylate cyclase (GGDEF) domain-containing protein n=1 Tax=Natronincola peptidivorans TaxID=426128 RepID=A0A1I0F547_9FIRM|nr:sensor domain-containing diguanylate cyclase [Natronincola peptidivorans]SET53216.1 PAS domain S-box-containing protein/diguanylate cyclase (GGDEF) domain-containing protein [Natronincola peptidivorans]